VITNTPFHGSKVPLRTWLFVLFEMCANKNGIAAREVARKYRLTNKTAWFVTHRVRLAMESLAAAPRVSTFVADETYIGGDPKNRHAFDRSVHAMRGRATDKTPVLALIDAERGEVRSKIVASVDGKTLGAAIREVAEPSGSTLWTDMWNGYEPISAEFSKHVRVNHKAGEYVRDGAGTNLAENYFSQLKRSLDGTHHHVSREHLPRYLSEFDFRYTTRKLTDTQRMQRLMGQTAGRRLSYKRITGQ
jgi:transposase-like protein